MAVSCGGYLIKIVLFVFNFLWLALGSAILYLGIRVLLKYNNDIADVIKETPSYAAIVLICAGGLIFVISFLGCCGAIKENYCMLNTYSGLICVCLVTQGVGAYLALKYHYDLEKYAEKGVDSAIQAYVWTASVTDPANKAINAFQKELKCCGAKDRHDWDIIEKPASDKDLYPHSCCKSESDGNKDGNCGVSDTWDKGCVEAMKDYLTMTIGSLGYVAIGIVLIELLIMISACCLARDVKNKYANYASPKAVRA